MNCRNCKEELPVGAQKTCPYCGARQDTYITPRNHRPAPRTKMKRISWLSMLSVAFVVVVVCILIPFLQGVNRKNDAAKILDKYDILNAVEDKTTTEWDNEVSYWVASINKYKKSYPDDKDQISRHEEMQNTLLGKDIRQSSIDYINERIADMEQQTDRNADDYATSLAILQAAIQRFAVSYPDESKLIAEYNKQLNALSKGVETAPGPLEGDAAERLEIIEALIKTAKDSIIDFETFNSTPGTNGDMKVTFRWTNKAGLGVESITVTLLPLDAHGEVVTDEEGEPMKAAVRTTAYCAAGDTKSSVFTKVWSDARVVSSSIYEVRLQYADNETQYLPPEVCSRLWKP